MKRILGKFTPLLLALYAGGASAQDAGNLLAATDHAVGNVNTVLQGLLAGDAANSIHGVETLATDLVADLADGTPLAAALGDDIAGSGVLGQPLLDGAAPQLGSLAVPLAEAGAPLASQVSPALLDNLPVIQGENLAFLGPQDSLGQYLARSGVPLGLIDVLLKVDLLGPGDGDGGGVLVPVFGGTGSAAPQIVVELGGTVQSLTDNPAETSTLLIDVQRLLEFVASNPFAGGSLPVPLLGLLVGDFSILPGGGGLTGGLPGLDPAQLPLPAGDLDAGTLTALTSGATLPGLE